MPNAPKNGTQVLFERLAAEELPRPAHSQR
jgi:hypothetical protein